MTSLRISAKGRRAAATLGVVSAGLLVLSACEKPTALATVTVGTSSVSSEAVCKLKVEKDEKGKIKKESLDRDEIQACMEDESVKSVDYSSGETLRVGVEPEVVEDGNKWVVLLDRQPIIDATNKTYVSFPHADIFATGGQGGAPESKLVSVLRGKDGNYTEVWSFRVNNTDAEKESDTQDDSEAQDN
ncbi:DUF2771 domain-containing protein [Streptomyces sp. KLOTTS4A1]|uniref:DUF2771 domain-containing protein n=1 Tax=Streptomyces sp. KLOTTS4A1 TaxID=3390996 RepID=UPI0039F4CB6E